MSGDAAPVDLPLVLPPSGAVRARVADAVIAAVRDGRLRPGDPMPSTRSLAAALGVSRGAVVAAYDELAAAGFVVTRAGARAVVADGADVAAAAGARTHVEPRDRRPQRNLSPPRPAPRWDLRPGHTDTGLVDMAAWRRAWRAAGNDRPGHHWEHAPSHPALRSALADHLRRTRGVAADPADLLVVPGVAATLRAFPEALGLVARSVVMEDPGYVEAVTAFSASGVDVRSMPVDDDGLDPASIPPGTAAVYVTPSHQYPLGARMCVARRVELLAWARHTGGLILEDDYDGEFRYDVAPLPALRSLPGAAEHVVYMGTASKVLTPTLRVAWLVAPTPLRRAMAGHLEARGVAVNEFTGAALAQFVASGALAAHHARAARTYAARRAALVAAVGRQLPGLRLDGVDAGLHVVLRLPDDVDDLAVVDAAAAAGVALSPLSAYCARVPLRGLVLCYASLPESHADAAVRVVAEAIALGAAAAGVGEDARTVPPRSETVPASGGGVDRRTLPTVGA